MSYRAVSELHILPPKQTVDQHYYVDEILTKSLVPAMKRRRKTGSILERSFMPNMSKAIFQQDGAPAHSSKKAMSWLEAHVGLFWGKGIWPGNSPDLSPIENLWSIVQSKLNEMPAATNRDSLIKNVKTAWSEIDPDTLENLICGMPERIKTCIKLKGAYIGK